MIIISDTGADIVNAECAFAFAFGQHQTLGTVLIAWGPGVNTVMVAGSEKRLHDGLAQIRKGFKEGWKVCDLLDLLGERANLHTPKIALARGMDLKNPNGGK